MYICIINMLYYISMCKIELYLIKNLIVIGINIIVFYDIRKSIIYSIENYSDKCIVVI